MYTGCCPQTFKIGLASGASCPLVARYARDMILTKTICFLFLHIMWRPLNFRILKLKMLITSHNKSADNFKYHIWNQHILLVNILEFEENQRGKISSSFFPPILPSIKPWSIKDSISKRRITIPESIPEFSLIRKNRRKRTNFPPPSRHFLSPKLGGGVSRGGGSWFVYVGTSLKI